MGSVLRNSIPRHGLLIASRCFSTIPTPEPKKPWIETVLPSKWLPYARLARLDKPVGTWLLLWPCWWSTIMATPAGQLPDLKLLATFTVGAFIMRSAGCTVNDMWDRNFDGKVERTKDRPLASGQLNMFQATAFLGAQLTAGLGVLLTLPQHTWFVGAASLPFVIAYPAFKRFTYWPQLMLGLTFNWGALVGYSAVHQSLDLAMQLPLYACGVAWTLVYDTIYAHQDKADDQKLGLRSTALRFGQDSGKWLGGFAALSVASLAGAGYAAGMGPAFYALSVGGAAAHYAWQLGTVQWDDRASCRERFESNIQMGAIVFGGMLVDRMIAMG